MRAGKLAIAQDDIGHLTISWCKDSALRQAPLGIFEICAGAFQRAFRRIDFGCARGQSRDSKIGFQFGYLCGRQFNLCLGRINIGLRGKSALGKALLALIGTHCLLGLGIGGIERCLDNGNFLGALAALEIVQNCSSIAHGGIGFCHGDLCIATLQRSHNRTCPDPVTLAQFHGNQTGSLDRREEHIFALGIADSQRVGCAAGGKQACQYRQHANPVHHGLSFPVSVVLYI